MLFSGAWLFVVPIIGFILGIVQLLSAFKHAEGRQRVSPPETEILVPRIVTQAATIMSPSKTQVGTK